VGKKCSIRGKIEKVVAKIGRENKLVRINPKIKVAKLIWSL